MDETVDPIRSNIAKNQKRDADGKFIPKEDVTKLPPITITTNNPTSVNTTNPTDLVNLKVTNPLVYIKYWWKRILANEGLEMKLKIKPLTIFGLALIIFSGVFELGGVVFPMFFPYLKFNNSVITTQTPTSTPEILKDTALKGTLTKTNTQPIKFYLITTSTEVVTLEIPTVFNLLPFVGKRILAVGTYDSKKTLEVEDIQDLEVLSTTPIPIPTEKPTPKPTETPNPTVMPAVEPTSTGEPTMTSSPEAY